MEATKVQSSKLNETKFWLAAWTSTNRDLLPVKVRDLKVKEKKIHEGK